jgi:hypothetical protein
MPIRINATKPRITDNGSFKTTNPRSFNHRSFKGGRRNFNRSRQPVSTFDQRNSLTAYITQAQAKPKQPKKSADGWATMASKKNITMRTPQRNRQMRSQNKFDVLSQPEKRQVAVALPSVTEYKAPIGVWGKPLAAAVKEDVEFDVNDGEIVEENDMTPLGPLQQYDMTPLAPLQPYDMTKNWGDMVDEEEEQTFEEERFALRVARQHLESDSDSFGRPATDNSAW